jgi:hypothetical protein
MATVYNVPCRHLIASQYSNEAHVAEWFFPKCAVLCLSKKDVSIGTDRASGVSTYHLHVPHQEKCIIGRIRSGILETNTCSNFIVLRPHCKITNFDTVSFPTRETYPNMCKLLINSKTTLLVGDVVLMLKTPPAAQVPGNTPMLLIEWFGFCFPEYDDLLTTMSKLQKAMRIWKDYIECFNPAFFTHVNNSINMDKYSAYTRKLEQLRDPFPLPNFRDHAAAVLPAKNDDAPALPAKRKCEEVADGK